MTHEDLESIDLALRNVPVRIDVYNNPPELVLEYIDAEIKSLTRGIEYDTIKFKFYAKNKINDLEKVKLKLSNLIADHILLGK
jgi:hypothetical protein